MYLDFAENLQDFAEKRADISTNNLHKIYKK